MMGLAFVIFGLYIGQEHKLSVFTRTGWEELNWKRLDKICTVILVKTALTREFVTRKVYDDQAEQNKVLTNK